MDQIMIHSKLYDYSVEFSCDFAAELESYGEHVAYIIDNNVYRIYEKKIPKEKNIYLLDAVEQKKNMDTVMEVICFLKDCGVKKNWTVVCIGGGITQDITTIACNLFLRNVNWHFFPTTLLAMCDSCIGGKCGINLGQYKNQIGVFYPPQKIIIDVAFLDTLSNEDYLNGWGELLKFSLTEDSGFFEKIKGEQSYIPCSEIENYIYNGLLVKKAVIEEDEFESDLRRILNYGHTFGHALEAYTNHDIPHGKGVIWGIDVVNYIAYREKLISQEYYLEIKDLIKHAFLHQEVCVKEADILFDIIRTDKKVKDNIINLAALNGRSRLIIYPMEINVKLLEMFKDYLRETHEYYNN